MMGLSNLTIKEALIQMKNGSLTPEELCKKCSQRREKVRSLNLYVEEISEAAMLERCRESQRFFDEGHPRALESIPVGFKNNFYIQGMRTTCASRLLLDFKPSYSATLVTRCIENGALLNGMLNMDEFAMGSSGLTSCHGPAKNPWTLVTKPSPQGEEASSEKSLLTLPPCPESCDEDFYLPGGSSGGSAAAVAAGTCLGAFGSDTGGSVRLPAAFCGVVGLKPTYGLLSRHGLIPLIDSMDCPGILTKTVEDCSIVLNSVLGHDSNDPSTSVTNPSYCKLDKELLLSDIHIGIPEEYHIGSTSVEITTLWQDTADMIAKAAAKVSHVSLPNTHQNSECYHFLCACEIATTFSRYFGKDFGRHKKMQLLNGETITDIDCQNFNVEARQRLLSGINFLRGSNYEENFAKAQRDRDEITKDFKRVFDSGVDLLLTPMSTTEAPLKSWLMSDGNHEKLSLMADFSSPANIAGVPAITLPVKLSQRGLPLNLQLIGRPFEETKLLSFAYWLEQSAQFQHLSLDHLDDDKH